MIKIVKLSIFISIIFIIFFGNSTAGNCGSITGTIYSIDTGETVPYVTVQLCGTQMGSISNESGEYIIYNVPLGEYKLKAELLGYKKLVKAISVSDDTISTIDLYLKEVPIPMAEVKVKAQKGSGRGNNPYKTVSKKVNLDMLTSQPGTGGDLLRGIQELPEVQSRSDFSSKMYIRGSGPEHNKIFVDGVPAYFPYRSYGLFSSFNPNLVKSIRLYPGGYPAEFGGRLSAILDIKYRSGSKKKFTPSVDLNAITANGTIEGSLFSPNNTYIISARRTYYDLLLKQNKYQTVYPHFYDTYGKLSLNKNSADQFNLSGWFTREGFRFNQDRNETDERSYNAVAINDGYSDGLRINWKHLGGEHIITEHTAYYIDEFHNLDMRGDIGAEFKNIIREAALKGEIDILTNNIETKSGYIAGMRREKIDWDGYNFPDSLDEERPPDGPDLRPIQEHFHYDSTFFFWAAYASNDLNISKRWTISNGYRLSGGGIINHISLSPRWGLSFRPWKAVRLAYSGGIFYQPPSYASFIEKNYLPELYRNPNIKPERAIHHITELDINSDDGWAFVFSLYRKYLDRLIYDNPAKSLYPDNVGRGEVNGMEISLTRDNDGWVNGNIFYSLSESILQTPVGEYYPNYDQRHTLTIGLDFTLSPHWLLSSHYRYGSGFPYTEIVGRKQGTNSEETPWVPVWGKVNAARYPFYSRLDLRLSFKFDWAQSKWRLYLEGINVLNHKNIYAYKYDREYITRSPITQIPFLPNFGLSIEF